MERNTVALLSGHERESPDPPSLGWLGPDCLLAKVQWSGLWSRRHVDEDHDENFPAAFEKPVAGQMNKGDAA